MDGEFPNINFGVGWYGAMKVLVACDGNVGWGKAEHCMYFLCVGEAPVKDGNDGSNLPRSHHAFDVSMTGFNHTISCGFVSTCCLKYNVVCEQEF